MIDMKDVIDRSSFDNKECIKRTFANASITTLTTLDNAPAKLGAAFCGHSTYSVVAELRALILMPEAVKETAVGIEVGTKRVKKSAKKDTPVGG